MSAPRPTLRPEPDALDIRAAIAACVVTCLVFGPFATIGVDPHHDGIMVKPALDVLHGQVLFRDTFCQYGVLTPYLDALAFGIFGSRLAVLRWLTVGLYGLAAGVLLLCWRVVLPRNVAFLSFAVWVLGAPVPVLVLAPWPSVPALVFTTMGLLFLLCGLRSRRANCAVLAGCSAGLTFLARQQVGVYVLVALCAGFALAGVLRRDRETVYGTAWCFAGFTGVIAPIFVALAAKGALPAWWMQTVVWPGRWVAENKWRAPWVSGAPVWMLLPEWRSGLLILAIAAAVILPMRFVRSSMSASAVVALLVYYGAVCVLAITVLHGGTPVLAGLPSAIVFAMVAALIAAGMTARRSNLDDRTVMRVCAILVCLASWLQMYPVDDLWHVFWALSPALGIVIETAWIWSRGRMAAVALALVLLLHPYGIAMVTAGWKRLSTPYVRLTVPPVLAGMRLPPDAAASWTRLGETIGDYVATHPRAAMLVEGRDALYATLVPNLENPTPFYVVWDGFGDFSAARARFVLTKRPLVFRQQQPPRTVEDALRSIGYTRLARISGGELLAPP